MRQRWFVLVLLAVLLIPTIATPTGTLVIPQTIANLSAGNQPASLLDQNWTAISSYINARELTIGLAAARPAAGTSGRYYFASDTNGGTLYVDTGAAWQQIAAALVSSLGETLTGLGLSNAGSNASTTFGVAAGAASSDDTTIANRVLMTLTSAYTKTTAAWAVGTGNGCLDTGAIAATTWYHIFLIERTDTGVVDVLCSLSATAPTQPTNYTKQRRIGSLLTSAGKEIQYFTQDGDYFVWATVPAINAVTNPGTSAAVVTLTVPPGLSVQAIYNVDMSNTAANSVLYLSDLQATDQAPSETVAPLGQLHLNGATLNMTLQQQVTTRTNSSAGIRYRVSASDANTVLRWATLGWIDRRGSR